MANVFVKEGAEGDKDIGVYLYTHWSGDELPVTVQAALVRGKDRHDDAPYLARIILCEMVKGDRMGTSGFGIWPAVGDGADRVVVVDVDAGAVKIGTRSWTFAEYIAADKATLAWATR